MLMNLYMKFRNYIVDFIRARNIPADKWKKTIIIRKIMRISLFVFPLIIYWLAVLILWIKFEMAKVIKNIFTVISMVIFIFLFYLIIKFRRIVKEYITDEYTEHFKNIGLTNKQNNAPVFHKMQYDPDNVGQEIYYFDDVDVDYSKFFEPVIIRGLPNIFQGYVRPDAGNKYGEFKLCVTPTSKDSCINLTINDTWLVENCIHIRYLWC